MSREVNRLRGKRSAQWLSDRTDELGYRVSRAVIADIENGRRKYVTTAEVVVLAAALNTAPIALLYPEPYDDVTEYLPGVDTSEWLALQWFSGLFVSWEVYANRDEYRRNMWALVTARKVDELEDRRDRLRALADPAVHDTVAEIQREIDELRGSDDR